ncbi:MAG TPA: segregation/condensation protein A [Anaerolineae bacterium]|nr:segregation/condensation protein A [Anaerolineae bacterium]
MNLNVFAQEQTLYRVETPVYQGPLDLLLQLIESAELDITKLALAQITEQYLVHLRELEKKIPEEISVFLIIAAKLLQIKSEALLPKPPIRDPGEEDPGEDLVRQLREYKKFKEVAIILGEREQSGLRSYSRIAKPLKVTGTIDLCGYNIHDLRQVAQFLFNKSDNKASLNTVVKAPKISIRQKIKYIIDTIHTHGKTTFQMLITGKRLRDDVVVTFLAMLELIKQHYVRAKQETIFGEISIVPTDTLNRTSDFELEFKD